MSKAELSRAGQEWRRLRGWSLWQQGWRQKDIAMALLVTKGAVSQWIKRGREEGAEGLRRSKAKGTEPRMSHEQRAQFPTFLLLGAEAFGYRGNVWTGRRVAEVIKRVFGISYHQDHCSRLLRQIGWSVQKPIERAAQRNEEAIKHWKEQWPARAKKAEVEKRTSIFVDESGFYLLPMVVRTYAPRGQTPVLRVKLTRDHLSAIGGITEKGRIFMQIQERAYCSEDVVRFLRLLLHKVSGNLLVIWDGSPIHRAQVIKKFLGTQEGKRLHLERLPGYAPERESPRARVEPAQTARIEKSVLPGSCSPGPRACARQRTPSPSAGDSAKLFRSRVGKRFVKNFSTPLFRERITCTERESHARAPKRSDRA